MGLTRGEANRVGGATLNGPHTPDASPTDASPTDASPTDASPTDASPTDASPTDASPTDASPTGASPTDASPTGASPTDASPTDASPTGASPTGASPTDASPTDASPTDASPTDASPTDASPTDASPTGASPTDASPTGASPTGASPTDASPTDASLPDAFRVCFRSVSASRSNATRRCRCATRWTWCRPAPTAASLSSSRRSSRMDCWPTSGPTGLLDRQRSVCHPHTPLTPTRLSPPHASHPHTHETLTQDGLLAYIGPDRSSRQTTVSLSPPHASHPHTSLTPTRLSPPHSSHPHTHETLTQDGLLAYIGPDRSSRQTTVSQRPNPPVAHTQDTTLTKFTVRLCEWRLLFAAGWLHRLGDHWRQHRVQDGVGGGHCVDCQPRPGVWWTMARSDRWEVTHAATHARTINAPLTHR